MPSTYSPLLRLELVGAGEQSGLWGDTTNKNVGTLLEQAIAGVAEIPLTGGAGTYTVQALDGTQDQARCAVLLFTGAPSGVKDIQIPSTEKLYVVRNDSTQNITVKTAAQISNPLLGGVLLKPSEATLVFCDGTLALAGIETAGVGTLGVSGGGTGQTTFATAGFLKTPGGQNAFTSSATVNAATEISGTLPIANGGTGTNTAPTSGALLIGTSSGTYTPNQLTAGTGITITPSSGGITISTSGGGGGVTSVSGSGNITVSPSTGNVNVSMTSAPTFSSYVTSPTYYIGNSPGTMYIQNSGGEMGFIVGGSQTAKVTNQGFGCQVLGVNGRASIGGGAAGGNFNLDVAGQPNQTVAFFTTTGSGGTGITINCTGGTSSAIIFQNNGATTGQIVCTPSGTNYNTASDRRLKTDITPLTNSGEVIDAIKPVQFKWLSTGKTDTGFVADELQQVIPSSVTGEPNAVDEDGKPVYQQIDAATPEIISLLVAELQSLRKRVAALEAK